jgi:hypothetical protein
VRYEKLKIAQYQKKLFVHILLLFTILVDLPMYIGFIIVGRYNEYAYAFHKFEAALLFMAYSVTIADWSALLYDIREDSFANFVLRRNTLIVINVLYTAISIANFVVCCVMGDLPTFTSSWIYIVGVLFQIFVSFSITTTMLYAGIKLSQRIRGVSKMLNSRKGEMRYRGWSTVSAVTSSPYRPTATSIKPCLPAPTSVPTHRRDDPIGTNIQQSSGIDAQLEASEHNFKVHVNESHESSVVISTTGSPAQLQVTTASTLRQKADFTGALWSLNLVMATCAVCMLIQVRWLIITSRQSVSHVA